MTSEIRTNTLTSRAGLSTVTLTDSGPMFSGITTFVDNSTFSVGTGGTIHAPATNVMALGTNSIDAIKIDSSGNVNISGILTASSISGVDINGDIDVDGHTNLDNVSVAGVSTHSDHVQIIDGKRLKVGSATNGDLILLHDGTDSIIDNSTGNLFFRSATHKLQALNGNDMIIGNTGGAVELYHNNLRKFFTTSTGGQISCGSDGDGLKLEGTTNRIDIVANSNRSGAQNTILELDAHWNNTSVAFIALATGDDTTNKDDGRIRFFTKPSGGTIAERLKIESDGVITAQKSATFGNTSDSFTAVNITSSTSGISELRFADTTANPGYLKYTHSNDIMEFVVGTNNQLYLYGSSREARFSGYVVAQSAGSGGSATPSFGATQSGMSSSSYNYILSGSNDVGNKCVMFVNGSTRSADGGANALTLRNDAGNLNLGNASTNTTIYGNTYFNNDIRNEKTTFRYDNGGGVGAYLSIQNRGSSAANTACGIVFGCDTSDAQLDGSDTGNGQIKVRNDGSDGGIMSFNVHTGGNFEAMKIVGNLNNRRNATNGNTAAMQGGVAFSAAGVAIDKSWDNYPGIHVFNTTGHSDTNQGEFRIHGWNTSYNSYPQASGSDFGVTVVADGMTITSDQRRKTGITTITDALDTVSKLRGVSFTMINRQLEPQTHMSMDNGKKLGFIAQEVIPLLPAAVIDSGDHVKPEENGYCDRYKMDYGAITPVLVESIKELKTKIETLEQENIALRVRVTNLEGN